MTVAWWHQPSPSSSPPSSAKDAVGVTGHLASVERLSFLGPKRPDGIGRQLGICLHEGVCVAEAALAHDPPSIERSASAQGSHSEPCPVTAGTTTSPHSPMIAGGRVLYRRQSRATERHQFLFGIRAALGEFARIRVRPLARMPAGVDGEARGSDAESRRTPESSARSLDSETPAI